MLFLGDTGLLMETNSIALGKKWWSIDVALFFCVIGVFFTVFFCCCFAFYYLVSSLKWWFMHSVATTLLRPDYYFYHMTFV